MTARSTMTKVWGSWAGRLHEWAPWLLPRTFERLSVRAQASAFAEMQEDYRQQTLAAMPGYRPGDRVAEQMADEYVRAEFPTYAEDRDYGDFIEYAGGGASYDEAERLDAKEDRAHDDEYREGDDD
ncbi:MAG: hypothetical protein JWP35_320 [Caulobacter sp.]|nr:hypothetical protein [Caulobacter sp.]